MMGAGEFVLQWFGGKINFFLVFFLSSLPHRETFVVPPYAN